MKIIDTIFSSSLSINQIQCYELQTYNTWKNCVSKSEPDYEYVENFKNYEIDFPKSEYIELAKKIYGSLSLKIMEWKPDTSQLSCSSGDEKMLHLSLHEVYPNICQVFLNLSLQKNDTFIPPKPRTSLSNFITYWSTTSYENDFFVGISDVSMWHSMLLFPR